MRKFAAITLLLSFTVFGLSFAQGADDPVKARQNLMKEVVGKNMKLIVAMLKEESEQDAIPYDAAKAQAALQAISEVPDKFVTLFPENTSMMDVKTDAKPEIWDNKADFESRAQGLKTNTQEAAKVASSGKDQLKPVVFGKVATQCKGCHEKYRQPDK
jgi:cytochrome c556